MDLQAELSRFRSDWQASLSQAAESATASAASATTTSDDDRFAALTDEAVVECLSLGLLESDQFVAGLLRRIGRSPDETRSRAALRIFEIAVAEESVGALGSGLRLYRIAHKIDEFVDREYTIRQRALHGQLQKSLDPAAAPRQKQSRANTSLETLIDSFGAATIQPSTSTAQEEEKTEAEAPFSLFSNLPHEIIVKIFRNVATKDLGSFASLARVCRTFAHIVLSERTIWRRLCEGPEFGFSAMLYTFRTKINGEPISSSIWRDARKDDMGDPHLRLQRIPGPVPYESYRRMLQQRARLWFNGVYVSKVTYTRQVQSTSLISWTSPVEVITYFRYLRFYRDGTVLVLLTHEPPHTVAPVFARELIPARPHNPARRRQRQSVTVSVPPGHHLLVQKINEQNAVVGGEAEPLQCHTLGDTLRGRWRLDNRAENDLYIETESVVPHRRNAIYLSVGKASSVGKGTHNSRVLEWKSYTYFDTLDDRNWGEYPMGQMKPYQFLRVLTFDNGLEGVDLPP